VPYYTIMVERDVKASSRDEAMRIAQKIKGAIHAVRPDEDVEISDLLEVDAHVYTVQVRFEVEAKDDAEAERNEDNIGRLVDQLNLTISE